MMAKVTQATANELGTRLMRLDERIAELRADIAAANSRLPDVEGADRAELVGRRRSLCEEFDVATAERAEIASRHREALIADARAEIAVTEDRYQEAVQRHRQAKGDFLAANEDARRKDGGPEERGRRQGRAEEMRGTLIARANEMNAAQLALNRVKARHAALLGF